MKKYEGVRERNMQILHFLFLGAFIGLRIDCANFGVHILIFSGNLLFVKSPVHQKKIKSPVRNC